MTFRTQILPLNLLFAAAVGLGACTVESGDTSTTTTNGSTSGMGNSTSGMGSSTSGMGSSTSGMGSSTSGMGSSTGGSTTGTDTGTAGTTGGGNGDPNYPMPDMTGCPGGLLPASFSMGFAVCAPACMDGMCPNGATGDAMGACVFNPDSSGDPCNTDTDCTVQGETCVMTGGGDKACLLDSDHCALICAGGATCPDGMECTDVGVCQYPAG